MMMMLFLLQCMLIFHGALCAEENTEEPVKNETAVETKTLESRSDSFKPSFLYDYDSDGTSEQKPSDKFETSEWSSGNQYKFQESDSVDFNYDPNNKDYETTASPFSSTYQETKWSKPLSEFVEETQKKNEEYYEKPFTYEESNPETGEKYYDKPFGYDGSNLESEGKYYDKPFGYDGSKLESESKYYDDSKHGTGEKYYEKTISYQDTKPLEYYEYDESKPESTNNMFSYEGSKSTDDLYYEKPFGYDSSQSSINDNNKRKEFSYDFHQRPFVYEGSKPPTDDYYETSYSYDGSKLANPEKSFTYEDYYKKAFENAGKPLSGSEYYGSKPLNNYEKPASSGKSYFDYYSGNNYQTIQSSKLFEFNEKIPMIKPFVMENSPREYIPLRMVEDYRQKGDSGKLSGSHVSIPPFKGIKSEDLNKKPMYEPIILGDNQNEYKILEAAKDNIKTLQQSIKDNTPFALPYTFKKDDEKEKTGGKNQYYFKFEDKRPEKPGKPKPKDSYNFKLFEDKYKDLPLVRPSDGYHGPGFTYPNGKPYTGDANEYHSNHGVNSFSKPNPPGFLQYPDENKIPFAEPYKYNPPKFQVENVYHNAEHVKTGKQLRKKVKKRPVVYWDDTKKHLLNLIPTPYEETPQKPPGFKARKPPKGPYIQRIPDPHNRFKDHYMLPDSVSNVGPHKQANSNSGGFFENLSNLLFGEFSNNEVVYMPIKPKRMRKFKRPQPRISTEERKSKYRAVGHVDSFNFEN